jgi:hypothetical protein
MNAKRLFPAAITVLILMLVAGGAWSFVIENEEALDRVSQIVNLRGVSIDGQITSIYRVMPNGEEIPVFSAFPAGSVLLITRFYFDLQTTSTEPTAMVFFDPFLYPAAGGGATFIVNGNASSSRSFGSGCAIGLPSATSPGYNIRAVTPPGTTIMPGTMNFCITGFILKSKATVAPLLLLESP